MIPVHCPLCMFTTPPDDRPAHAERCHAEEIAQRQKNPADPVIPLLIARGFLAAPPAEQLDQGEPARAFAAAVLAPLDRPGPLAVACPECHAAPGLPCMWTTKAGGSLRPGPPHLARTQIATYDPNAEAPRCEALDKKGKPCPSAGRHHREGRRVCGAHGNATEITGWRTPPPRPELAGAMTGPRSVLCPTCHAEPGKPCRRPSGHPVWAGQEHASRTKAAELAGDVQAAAQAAPTSGPAMSAFGFLRQITAAAPMIAPATPTPSTNAPPAPALEPAPAPAASAWGAGQLDFFALDLSQARRR